VRPAVGRGEARRDDAGVSLAELLVAIMIFGIVLTVVTTTFVSLTRATSQARSVDGATRQATNGLDSVARVIRAASNNPQPGATALTPAISVAGPSSLTLISSVNLTGSATKPQLTSYSIDPATRGLVEKTTQAESVSQTYWQFTGVASTRTLAVPVLATAVPLFRYYDVSGAEIKGVTGSGLLDDAQRQAVASVAVSLSVGRSDKSVDGVTLSTAAVLSNLFPSAVLP
jgi:prepilin-type N-terminal cleavage/methylation domain-containing protein